MPSPRVTVAPGPFDDKHRPVSSPNRGSSIVAVRQAKNGHAEGKWDAAHNVTLEGENGLEQPLDGPRKAHPEVPARTITVEVKDAATHAVGADPGEKQRVEVSRVAYLQPVRLEQPDEPRAAISPFFCDC